MGERDVGLSLFLLRGGETAGPKIGGPRKSPRSGSDSVCDKSDKDTACKSLILAFAPEVVGF